MHGFIFVKTKLLDCLLTISDVLNNVNLDKISKSNLSYQEISCLKTFIDYLDCIHKDVFAMTKQLGPSTIFVIFTTGVNNWPILIKTLKELYDDYICKNVGLKNDESLDIKELVRNDPITCPCCYEHKMNNFRKLI